METINQRKRKIEQTTLPDYPSKIIQRSTMKSFEQKHFPLFDLPPELILELDKSLGNKERANLSATCKEFRDLLRSRVIQNLRLVGSPQIDNFLCNKKSGHTSFSKEDRLNVKQLRIELSGTGSLHCRVFTDNEVSESFLALEAARKEEDQLVTITSICPRLSVLKFRTRAFATIPENLTTIIKSAWSSTLTVVKIFDNNLVVSDLTKVLVYCTMLKEVCVCSLSSVTGWLEPLSLALLHHSSLQILKIDEAAIDTTQHHLIELESLFDNLATLGSSNKKKMNLTSLSIGPLKSIEAIMGFLSCTVSANLEKVLLHWVELNSPVQTLTGEYSNNRLQSTPMEGDLILHLNSGTITPLFYQIVGQRIKVLHCHKGHHRVNVSFMDLLAAINDGKLPHLEQLHIRGTCNCCREMNWSSHYRLIRDIVRKKYGSHFIFKVPYDTNLGSSTSLDIETAIWKKWQNNR